MVAENSMVCLTSGTMPSTRSMSGRKPRSSISSASSSTSTLTRAEHQVAAVGQVQQPARGADHQVDPVVQGGDLRFVRAAAVDGGHRQAHVLGGLVQVAGDLHAQLAGRHHHQRAGGPAGRQLAVGGQRQAARPARAAAAAGRRSRGSCPCRCGPGRSGRRRPARWAGSGPGWRRSARCRTRSAHGRCAGRRRARTKVGACSSTLASPISGWEMAASAGSIAASAITPSGIVRQLGLVSSPGVSSLADRAAGSMWGVVMFGG